MTFAGKRSIGIGIIGAGYWGPNLIRNFDQLDECRVVWVCDKKPGRLQYVREHFPEITVTDAYGEILKDDSVEAVVVVTPVSTHYRLTIDAIESGKHVFVEKPLARTAEQALDIVEKAAKNQLVLATGHVFIYHPAISVLKECINRGQIGPLFYGESGRVNLGPPASEVDVIWDLAVHDISIQHFLWEKTPVEVIALGRRFLHPKLVDVAFLHLRFDDGSFSQHHVSWLSPEKVRRFFVAGGKGSAVFDDTLVEGKLKIIDQGVDSRIGLGDEEVKELFYRPEKVVTPVLATSEPVYLECQHFLD